MACRRHLVADGLVRERGGVLRAVVVGAVSVEVPGVLQGIAIRVARAPAVEAHRERGRAARRLRDGDGDAWGVRTRVPDAADRTAEVDVYSAPPGPIWRSTGCAAPATNVLGFEASGRPLLPTGMDQMQPRL